VTSKWVNRLVELGEVEVSDWRVFSLELINGGEETIEAALEYRAAPALRTAVAVRAAQGGEAVGRFYHALDMRTWEGTEDIRSPDTLRGALTDAGLDPSLHDAALDYAATWDAVVAEHRAVVDELGAFGVPTIALDGGDGPSIFGPVISRLPPDDEAVELWRHVVWLMRSDNFWELKRGRAVEPDLEGYRVRKAEREARARAEPG
jgi:mycothiol-dependent nitroreductase-like protein